VTDPTPGKLATAVGPASAGVLVSDRAKRVARARELRAQGLTYREIGERLGVALSTAQEYIKDPDLSKHRARRFRYGGQCIDCGAPTDGSQGRDHASTRCRECSRTKQKADARWTPETVTEAIRRFATRYGRTPSATDFNPPHAKYMGHAWRAERFYSDGDYPYTGTVQGAFGSWSAAIKAAGLAPIGSDFARGSNHLADHLADEREAA
jgi:transposase